MQCKSSVLLSCPNFQLAQALAQALAAKLPNLNCRETRDLNLCCYGKHLRARTIWLGRLSMGLCKATESY